MGSFFFVKSGYQVTAIDASIEMVRYAQKKVSVVVMHQEFSKMTFNEEFDGIWTCASLLHIARDDMQEIFNLFIAALKPNGIWFISFKYGEDQTIEHGRLFSRFTTNNFGEFIKRFPELKVLQMWQSHSNIQNIHNDWLQVLVKKEI